MPYLTGKNALEASHITRISPVYLAILSQSPVSLYNIYNQNCCRNTSVSLEKGSFIFSCFFSGISRENATCTCWFLKFSLTRQVWVTPNMWTGCSCFKVSWGASNLEGNTGFHRCSTWLSLKDSKHFCPLFMLGNPTLCL